MFNVFGVLALIACFARPNYFDVKIDWFIDLILDNVILPMHAHSYS